MRLKNKDGFTLIELVTVVLIIGIMSAIAVPNILAWLPNMRLKAAARDVFSSMKFAQVEAVKQNQNVCVHFITSNCSSSPFPSGQGTVRVYTGSTTLQSVAMPAHAALCYWSGSGQTTCFRSNGLVLNNNIGSVTIRNDKGVAYRIILSMAGGIRLEKL